jgi:hypothetical protein
MQMFSGQRHSFPLKYLGLPLSTRGFKTIGVQPVGNKVANKLVSWHGKNISTAEEALL